MLAATARAEVPYEAIDHIIVISLENHSFDNLFGHFPGAEGLDNAGETAVQRKRDGTPYAYLPPVMHSPHLMRVPDVRFPAQLANAPFPIDAYLKPHERTSDPTHRFYHQIDQIHDGKMDRFVAVEGSALPMGYYEGSKLGLWRYAQRFVLMDHFFHAAFGGSMLNHFWLVCACTPRFPDAPEDMVIRFDKSKDMTQSGSVTPDGYAVNTAFAANGPHPKALTGSAKLMPPQTLPTIADRLEKAGVSWAWYAGGWDDANAGRPSELFQFHHQPFVYFAGFERGGARREAHLKDVKDFLHDLAAGTLPAVSFYK
ncbi:MAG: hypothetical protein K2Q01_10025, partial [Rickettsiales bacterium]|nr:hypothetical protein [Rickettsiales bacterium]